jgi:hypothetical protein
MTDIRDAALAQDEHGAFARSSSTADGLRHQAHHLRPVALSSLVRAEDMLAVDGYHPAGSRPRTRSSGYSRIAELRPPGGQVMSEQAPRPSPATGRPGCVDRLRVPRGLSRESSARRCSPTTPRAHRRRASRRSTSRSSSTSARRAREAVAGGGRVTQRRWNGAGVRQNSRPGARAAEGVRVHVLVRGRS